MVRFVDWKHTPYLEFTEGTLHLDYDTMAKMSYVQNIEPQSWDADKCKYINLVHSVLESHKAPSLKQFRTSFYVNKFAHLKVAKWLEFAFSKGVETLELDFQRGDPKYQVVFEELLLRGSGLRQTSFLSLKDVYLQELIVSGEAIKMLLHNSPSLEALSIGFATLSSDVEVCGVTTLVLKCLQIYYCTGNKSVKLYAPNLTSLMVDDRSGKLLLENVPNLVEANFIFRSSSLDEAKRFASAIFCFSCQLKTLCLTLQQPEIFLANVFVPQMPNLNKLVVEYSGVRTQSLLPVTALVWASPHLEEFKLMVTQSTGVIGGAPVQVARDAERSPHRHLKLFNLAGFKDGDVRHVELANYILDNCVALEKIIIQCSSGIDYLLIYENGFEDKMQAATVYAEQQFEGKIHPHIQLANVWGYVHMGFSM